MASRVQISDSEWVVMEAIWDAGPCRASDIIRRIGAMRDWNHSTIRTLLARLIEKGVVSYDVQGARYIYRAAVSREHCVRQEGRSFLERVFGGDVGALLAHFASDAKLDQEQIDQLRLILAEKGKPKEKRK